MINFYTQTHTYILPCNGYPLERKLIKPAICNLKYIYFLKIEVVLEKCLKRKTKKSIVGLVKTIILSL